MLARSDIDGIVKYIGSELRNPTAANNLLEKITKRVKVLGQFPEVCSFIKINNKLTQSRYLVVDNYLLLYVIRHETLYITHIVYGRSDYLKFLAE
jgi:plasmid stabilization system protein ParE